MNKKGQMGLENLPRIALVFLVVILLFTLSILILTKFQNSTVVAGSCSYVTSDDGTDYMAVTNTTNNVTAMADNELFVHYDYITPRLNISNIVVSEGLIGGNRTYNSQTSWFNPTNPNVTSNISNGTVTIDKSNYSMVNVTSNLWAVNWTVNTYHGQLLTLKFNKTFVKNYDDLMNSSQTIYSGAGTNFFLTQNTPTLYGEDKTFRLTGYGNILNNTNWAVGWTLVTKTCTSSSNSVANESIQAGIEAVAEIPTNWMGIISIVIIASILITIVVVALGKNLNLGFFGGNNR